jgi:16S rRNA processing protein RimM
VSRQVPEQVVAGVVAKPHGLDGSFHVRDAVPALLAEGAQVSVGGREVTIARRAGTDARPIVRVDGCEDRDAAEQLRGEQLLASASAAPALAEDEFYAHELEGCEVRDGDERVGVVVRLLPLPSCEALEVQRDAGPALLIPLVRDAIRGIDVDARSIDVDLAFLGEGS